MLNEEELEQQKAIIKKKGGWTGRINIFLNRFKRTKELKALRKGRLLLGLPTDQIEYELSRRGESYEHASKP